MKTNFEINIDYINMEQEIDKAISDALKELEPIITKYVKANHRYKDRSGELTRSTLATAMKDFLEVKATAPHAPFISSPRGTWNGDNWIEESLIDNEKLILDTVQKHINLAINRINK